MSQFLITPTAAVTMWSNVFILTMAAAATASCLRFQNLVSFGDSLTDEGRLNYMFVNGGLPPVGELLPPSNSTASGGKSWPRFVAQNAGIKSLTMLWAAPSVPMQSPRASSSSR